MVPSFWSQALISVAGSLVSRLTMMAGLALCARYLFGPAEIGLWGTLFAITLYLVPLGTLRYEVAVLLPEKDEDAARIVVGTIALSLLATVLCSIAATAALLSGMPRWLLGDEVPAGVLALLPLLLFSQCLRQLALAWLSRMKQFRAFAATEVLQSVLVIGLPTLAGILFHGHVVTFAIASAMGYLLSAMATVATSQRYGFPVPAPSILSGTILRKRKAPRPARRDTRWRIDWPTIGATLRRYRAYPRYLVPYSLSGGLVLHLLVVVFASVYGIGIAGAYLLANRLVYAPALLFVGPLRQVFYAYGTTSAGRLDAESLRRMRHLLTVLVFVTPLGAWLAYDWGAGLVGAWLGANYVGITQYMQILLIAGAAHLLTGWLDRTYDLLGHQLLSVKLQLFSDCIVFGTTVALALAGVAIIPTLQVFALLTVTAELLWLGVTLTIAGQPRSFVVGLYGMLSSVVAGVIGWRLIG